MKRIFTQTRVRLLGLLIFIVGSAQAVQAQQYTLTDNDVVVTNGVIESCSYNFAIKDIVIPETLDGQTVTAIADKDWSKGVFYNKGIIKVTLPSTLTTIGFNAFQSNNLTSVTIPQGVKIIGSAAFHENKLLKLTIPGSVKAIGFNAFFENQISELTLSEGLTKIGYGAFQSNQITTVTIPNSVNTIDAYAFNSNNLTNVTLVTSVTRIGENAFSNNSNLASITLPTPKIDGATFINWVDTKGNTYAGGAIVTEFTLGYTAEVEYILTDNDVVVTNGVIESCSYSFIATSIIIPETLDGQTVKGVDDGGYNTGVFKNKGLLSVKYPMFFDTVGDNEFSVNKLIRTPLMLAKVGSYAFGFNELTELKIPGNVGVISCGAFRVNDISKLTIDYGVTEIGYSAFEYNELTEVTIPASVNYIGSYAFAKNQLTKIILPVVDKLGYQFKGWKNGDGDVIEGNTAVSNFETSYSAILEPYKFTISGKISGADGVLIKLSGDATNYKTVDNGQEYFFTVNYGQSVKVTATKDGCSFEPAEFLFETIQSDKTDNNFVATVNSYTVAFNVTSGNSPFANATVTFNENNYTTNANGVVVIENVIAGNYKYSVSAQGYQTQTGEIAVTNQKVSKAISLSKVTAIDNILSDAIKVYPNPVASTLNIKGSELIGDVTISNVAGVVVYSTKLNSYEIGIDVSNLQSGVYILRAFVDKGVVVKQFVKK